MLSVASSTAAAPVSSAGVTPASRRDTSARRGSSAGGTDVQSRTCASTALVNASNALLRPTGIAPKRDHQRPGRRRRRERIAHEAGLADAGLAADEGDAGTIAGAEHTGETLQLAVAPDDPIRRVRA